MIQLKNIQKVYQSSNGKPVMAVNDVNLHVKKGEIFGIIGKSGAGKSSLIRCINMLERPSAGNVILDGIDMCSLNNSELRNVRQKIGMIFQHFNLLASRTVYDNVAFPLELSGMSKEQIEKEVLPLLELVGLSDKQNYYPSQLSGGQKQRVGIARALANKPKVLLCDEATSALDPQTTKSILDLLKNINATLKLTIVLITHEMQVIKEICDKVTVIEGGKIIEEGTVFDIFTKPQNPTTKEFIKSIVNHDLPDSLKGISLSEKPKADSNLLLRISFLGKSADEPIIASMIRRFNVDTNILYGNIDHIQNVACGTMVIELSGDQQNIANALNYLKSKELGLEVIGYVARNYRAIG